MSRVRRIAFWALVAAQALIPLAMVALNEAALAAGQKVRLQALPVDPHDPFRGEYVALAYEISTISVPAGTDVGDVVYVELGPSGRGAWTGSDAQGTPPDGRPFIRGRVTAVYGGRADVEYGIETYFVEEGQGPKLEAAVLRRDLYVDVVIDDEGEAKIEEAVVVPR